MLDAEVSGLKTDYLVPSKKRGSVGKTVGHRGDMGDGSIYDRGGKSTLTKERGHL